MIDTRCGLSCVTCIFREKTGCGGCIATNGHPFHGECRVAVCCQNKGFVHCGECSDIPCQMLHDYSFDPVHGDNPHGARIDQCKKWAKQKVKQLALSEINTNTNNIGKDISELANLNVDKYVRKPSGACEENVKIKIVSIRENPRYVNEAISYFQKHWANKNSMMVYDDCIRNCINAKVSLPQWYLLVHDDKTIGCAGLITNDFISRMDLFPWVCALYIEKEFRGNGYGLLLLEKAKQYTAKMGFGNLYLSTDHIGYYEHYGFTHIGIGYHPWGKSSRIYCAKVK